MDDRAILADLPTSIRGFVYHDDDGEPVIVVNARLSREQNQKTWFHEKRHIERGELNDTTYYEYGGNTA